MDVIESKYDALIDVARDNGLQVSPSANEPYVAFIERSGPQSTWFPQPNETVALIEYGSDKVGYVDEGFAVSMVTADKLGNWAMQEDPDRYFDDRQAAVTYAAAEI